MDWINPAEEDVASVGGVDVGGRGVGGGEAAFSAASPSFEFSNNGNSGKATTLRIKKARRLLDDEDFFCYLQEKKFHKPS